MPGTLSLYHKGNFISSKKYHNNFHRDKAIDYWKKIYSYGFYSCEVVDAVDPTKLKVSPPVKSDKFILAKKYGNVRKPIAKWSKTSMDDWF